MEKRNVNCVESCTEVQHYDNKHFVLIAGIIKIALQQLHGVLLDTIDKQAEKLNSLEQEVTTLKASRRLQSKRLKRNERWLHSLLRAHQLPTEVIDDDESNTSVSYAPHRHDMMKETQATHGGIRETDEQPMPLNMPRRQSSDYAAFTAYLDHPVDVGLHQVIKYNRIITNEGNDYNTNTGVFTCEMPGIYMIFFTIGERDVRDQYAALMVNGHNVVDATADGFHSAQDVQGSNMVVMRLNRGDSVWVECQYSAGHTEGSALYRYTTFTEQMASPKA